MCDQSLISMLFLTQCMRMTSVKFKSFNLQNKGKYFSTSQLIKHERVTHARSHLGYSVQRVHDGIDPEHGGDAGMIPDEISDAERVHDERQ